MAGVAVLWLCAVVFAMPLAGQDREPMLTGMVELASEPAGAEVFEGDSLLGRTPMRVRRADLQDIAVWFPGRGAWNAQVLRPDTAAPSADVGVVLLRFSSRSLMTDMPVGVATEYRGGFRLPPADILLPAGLGLAAGIAAVMLKQHADGLYDDYLRTGDASLLSQTEKYDIYAGVSLLLLQAGLGYFVYRLFDE